MRDHVATLADTYSTLLSGRKPQQASEHNGQVRQLV